MSEVEEVAMVPSQESDAELLQHLLPHFRKIVVTGNGIAYLAGFLEHTASIEVTRMGRAKDAPMRDVPDAAILLRLAPADFIARLRQIAFAPSTLVYGVFKIASLQQDNAFHDLQQALSDLGLGIYTQIPLANAKQIVLVCVSPDYDPIAHARELHDSGNPGYAYHVLQFVPEPYRATPDAAALVASETQIAHLAWAKELRPAQRASQFAQAQSLFYQAASNAPSYPPSYQCQAEYWRMLGDANMGARLLRSLLHVTPNDAAQRQLNGLAALRKPPRTIDTPEPPDWDGSFRPRILFILNQRPHFGLDVLYDGLCRVIGANRVIDFPSKETLHGAKPELLKNYPCCFDWPSHAETEESVLSDLRNGAYDLVLFGDCENSLPEGLVQRILAAKGATPLFVVDEMDEPTDARLFLKDRFAMTKIAGYFKREMLACVDYGANVFPLPFACPDHLVQSELPATRHTGVFWAGHRQFGLRRLYLEHLEERFHWNLKEVYAPVAYVERLLDSRIGINIFGYGFDTVRFWELPAHGCLLLSERLPIHIPHPFTHGKNAVFFDDLPSLVDLLDEHMANPDKARAVARAGHKHLREYHTGSRRAAQLLGWLRTLV